MSRVIGVVSGKGGVGKTVVAINLAASLQKYYKKKVLLVDANVTTPHLGLYLGLYSTPVTLNDVVRGRVEIEKAVYEHKSGLHVLPASMRHEDMKGVDWQKIRESVEKIKDNYDFLIVDSAPGFNRESLITLGMCSETLFVTNPVVHSAADLIKCREISKELNINPVGVALNMVRKKKYEICTSDLEELVGMDVLCSIPYDEKVMESVVQKKSAIELSQSVDREILKISRHITGDASPAHDGGFFSRIFGFLKA